MKRGSRALVHNLGLTPRVRRSRFRDSTKVIWNMT